MIVFLCVISWPLIGVLCTTIAYTVQTDKIKLSTGKYPTFADYMFVGLILGWLIPTIFVGSFIGHAIKKMKIT